MSCYPTTEYIEEYIPQKNKGTYHLAKNNERCKKKRVVISLKVAEEEEEKKSKANQQARQMDCNLKNVFCLLGSKLSN